MRLAAWTRARVLLDNPLVFPLLLLLTSVAGYSDCCAAAILPFPGATSHVAGALLHQGRTIEAKELLETLLPVLESSLGANHREVAICRFRLALCHSKLEQYTEAERLLLTAQPAMESAFGALHPQFAALLIERGNVYRLTGRLGDSEKVLRQALKIIETTLGPGSVLTGKAYGALGSTYYSMGQYLHSISFFNRALGIFEKLHDQREAAVFWANLGNARFASGQLKEAETAWRRALDAVDGLPELQPLRASTLTHLGGLKLLRGGRAEAEHLILEAAAIAKARRITGQELLPILDGLARLYLSRGDFELAGKTYDRALAIALSTLGPMHPDTAVLFQSSGSLRVLQKQFREAEPFYTRALESVQTTLGERHPLYGTYLAEYAALLRKLKRKSEAKQAEDRLRAIREETRIQAFAGNTVDIHELHRQKSRNP